MDKPANILPESDRLHDAAEVMRALAHPQRLRMLELLSRHTSANVYTIYTELGIEQSTASQHLRILRQSRLVNTCRQGKQIYYLPDEQRLQKAALAAGILAKMVQGK